MQAIKQNIIYMMYNMSRESIFCLFTFLGQNGPSLPDGPAAIEARLSQQSQQAPRVRGNAMPSLDSGKSFMKWCCIKGNLAYRFIVIDLSCL